ncbi:ATP-dependent nuclease [Paraburkholderia fungorum]|uniref:ATP-dependent nuclease n=1 Tax=Paraburkholderia fungorum TaxID=134537 RepID=UPI002096BE41|nr:AAA family ATPase [Paraburkholderia fungorum]USX06672.1 AAA family ATPase [Paraburkholderia fungorum]
MKIDSITLKNYRNFADATIHLAKNTLVIGGNDVGKTNMVHALRLLLDKTLSEMDIEPTPMDFHIAPSNGQAKQLSVLIAFSEVHEDAVLSQLKGFVSEKRCFFLRYDATREPLDFRIYAGHAPDGMEEIPGRFYLKHLNLKYIHSQRDLARYIRSEKKHLLRLAQENRDEADTLADNSQLQQLSTLLGGVNEGVRQLKYVSSATDELNGELRLLAHHHAQYKVSLDTGAININQFIEQLELGASTNGAPVMLGGDGRNNQILLALWKARSVLEHDRDSEVVIYCVEEPEAHLHPHQQRKLASYLIDSLPGQTIVTSHSPQIASSYRPDSIVRLLVAGGATRAASNGCSQCIDVAWQHFGYRMSVLPAEAFFASAVLLVEGPSEMLFYAALASANGIDLDQKNISLLSVDGVQFDVYVRILNALEIPWSVRTDNDISDIVESRQQKRQLAGMNRALALAGLPSLPHADAHYTHYHSEADGVWAKVSAAVAPHGVFLSLVDLEHDIGRELPHLLNGFKGKSADEAVAYLQDKKAIRMREFLEHCRGNLRVAAEQPLLRVLRHCVAQAGGGV